MAVVSSCREMFGSVQKRAKLFFYIGSNSLFFEDKFDAEYLVLGI